MPMQMARTARPLVLPLPLAPTTPPCADHLAARYAATPSASGSASVAADAKFRLSRDGTLNLGAGFATSQVGLGRRGYLCAVH